MATTDEDEDASSSPTSSSLAPPPAPPSSKLGSKAHLLNILQVAGIPCKARDKVGVLFDKCRHLLSEPEIAVYSAKLYKKENDGDGCQAINPTIGENVPMAPPPCVSRTERKELKVVVKCSLRRVLGGKGRDGACVYNAVFTQVDKYVNIISRLFRRSSLVMNYHLTRLIEQNVPAPDFFAMTNDTYWKNWLRLGLGGEDGYFPDDEVKATYESVQTCFGDPLQDVTELPASFDQVLAYAATTFKTAVINNACVPLFNRLGRLVKDVVERQLRIKTRPDGVNAGQVMSVMRSANFQASDAFQAWPPELQAFVVDVRSRLQAAPDDVLHDDWGRKRVSFPSLFAFNVWMADTFEALGQRRNALSPIFHVHRAHVRLDLKVLFQVCRTAFPASAAVQDVKAAKEAHDQDVARGGHGHADPDTFMLVDVPRPQHGRQMRKKAFGDEEAWKAHTAAWDAYDAEVDRIKASDAYKAQHAKHEEWMHLQRTAAASLFTRLPNKNGWTFDGSIVTDGVAVSVQYSRTVTVIVATSGVKKRTSRRAAHQQQEGKIVEDYDRSLSMFFETANGESVVVLGNDPGRNNIATICATLDDATREKMKVSKKAPRAYKKWTLTRGQYYHEAGIHKANKEQAERFACFKERWNALGGEDSALRSSKSAVVRRYLEQYATLERDWWEAALKGEESVTDLLRYLGKRRVLDAFFAKVKKEAQRMFPGSTVKLAYGSAFQSMKPTGRGEVSAPVSGAFKAAKRVFEDDLHITDETRSTMADWATGKRVEMVYKAFLTDADGRVKEQLRHTAARYAPLASTDEEARQIDAYMARRRHKDRMRRGAVSVHDERLLKGGDACTVRHQAANKHEKRMRRHPEVRGLRFCPESGKFYDRDAKAAVTVGRLCVMKLTGAGRPAPFCRSVKLA